MARRGKRGRPVHGILLLDKPAGGSSNQALQRVRRLFNAQKAGHTGTLDPLATGMLPICFGEATKLGHYLLSNEKGYETTLQLGVTTDSADADGTVLEQRPVPETLDRATFEAVCAHFTGAQQQVPPMVSALKHQGKRLYELAREGVDVPREPRSVTIEALEILAFEGTQARLSVRCSKGTYIRSLVSDIGEALGCGAHVGALRRTFVAPFEGQPMVTIEALEAALVAGIDPARDFGPDSGAGSPASALAAARALDAYLLPVQAALPDVSVVHVNEAGARAFGHGQPLRAAHSLDQMSHQKPLEPMLAGDARPSVTDTTMDPERAQLRCVYDPLGQLLGLGRQTGDGADGVVEPVRVFQYR